MESIAKQARIECWHALVKDIREFANIRNPTLLMQIYVCMKDPNLINDEGVLQLCLDMDPLLFMKIDKPSQKLVEHLLSSDPYLINKMDAETQWKILHINKEYGHFITSPSAEMDYFSTGDPTPLLMNCYSHTFFHTEIVFARCDVCFAEDYLFCETKCGHYFHSDCLARLINNSRYNCFVCREPFH
jgi:hypothetical protein